MPSKPEESLEIRKKRLRFQAWHRGTKEADMVLGNFVDKNMETLTRKDCDFLEALFQEADQDIMNWVTGKEDVPEGLNTPLMKRLLTLDHMPK